MRTVKAIIIFFIALVAFVRFAPQDSGGNPQHVTRTALTLSIIEGRLDIDQLAEWTVDKAQSGEHYYADKPPGLSLLAVPGVAVAQQAMLAAGRTDPTDFHTFGLYVTVASITTVCLLSALAVMLLYLFARRLGASDAAALFGCGALAFGTPFFSWSSTFFAHPVSGSMLLIAAIAVGWDERPEDGSPLVRGGLVGLLLGYLMVIDLTAGPAAALIGVWALVRSHDRWRELLGLVLGGAAGIAPLLVYNLLAFGSPLRLGYSQVVGFEGMKSGLFGISVPDPVVLGELLFGHFRGLLPLSPVLLLVPFGLWTMWKAPRLRGLAIVVAGTIVSYLLINASYHYWDGGGSTGPRHLVAMLPLTAVALVFAWPPRRSQQAVVLVLLGVSLTLSWVAAAAGTFASADVGNPLFDYLLPRFFRPEVLARGAMVPLYWVAFAGLVLLRERPSGAQRYQLAA